MRDSEIPKPPEGHRWKEVRHDNSVTWLVSWTENVGSNIKYIMFNPSSKIKVSFLASPPPYDETGTVDQLFAGREGFPEVRDGEKVEELHRDNQRELPARL